MIFEQIEAGGDRNFSYLIGDEDSIFHKRNYFQLSAQGDTASIK